MTKALRPDPSKSRHWGHPRHSLFVHVAMLGGSTVLHQYEHASDLTTIQVRQIVSSQPSHSAMPHVSEWHQNAHGATKGGSCGGGDGEGGGDGLGEYGGGGDGGGALGPHGMSLETGLCSPTLAT